MASGRRSGSCARACARLLLASARNPAWRVTQPGTRQRHPANGQASALGQRPGCHAPRRSPVSDAAPRGIPQRHRAGGRGFVTAPLPGHYAFAPNSASGATPCGIRQPPPRGSPAFALAHFQGQRGSARHQASDVARPLPGIRRQPRAGGWALPPVRLPDWYAPSSLPDCAPAWRGRASPHRRKCRPGGR